MIFEKEFFPNSHTTMTTGVRALNRIDCVVLPRSAFPTDEHGVRQ